MSAKPPPTKSPFRVVHVEINVSDLRRSREFYERLFPQLGFWRRYTWDSGDGWTDGGTEIFLSQADSRFTGRGFHRKAPGLNHLAFQAPSREAVDAFHQEFLIPREIRVLYGGPKEYPQYAPGYYAVYFEDPDRLKIECCFIPDFARAP